MAPYTPHTNDTPHVNRTARNVLAVLLGGAVLATATAANASPPPIRTTGQSGMPACVTPERLMAYLRARNPKLDGRFDDIARWYKTHGEAWRVRWDYAFFQMIIETNHLSYRTGSGSWGDVDPGQNNFAGIGTTGGGVPGDGYPDVSTGVLAQIQHLVAYAGERMDKPIAPRTQLKQDDIIAISERLGRPVTFADLAGRWAVDRQYARSIESVAERFRASQCSGGEQVAAASVLALPQLVREPAQVFASQRSSSGAGRLATASLAEPVTPAASPPGAVAPAACRVQTASYVGRGGASTALLIRAIVDGAPHYTALQVLDGFERSMADSFIAARAPGGAMMASFETSDAALAKAYELCPAAR